MGVIDTHIQAYHDAEKLRARNQRAGTLGSEEERMTERNFVRAFGSKIKTVRYSRRTDFVGLMVCGKNTGFWVTRRADGKRVLRIVSIVDNKLIVTGRYLNLKDDNSVSNLQRGLLRWVQ